MDAASDVGIDVVEGKEVEDGLFRWVGSVFLVLREDCEEDIFVSWYI